MGPANNHTILSSVVVIWVLLPPVSEYQGLGRLVPHKPGLDPDATNVSTDCGLCQIYTFLFYIYLLIFAHINIPTHTHAPTMTPTPNTTLPAEGVMRGGRYILTQYRMRAAAYSSIPIIYSVFIYWVLAACQLRVSVCRA